MKSSIWESEWFAKLVQGVMNTILLGIVFIILLFAAVVLRGMVYRIIGVG